MGLLYLIRHGQASFGAADYDVLSETGHTQSRALGRWFAAQGIRPDRVAHGGMRRQRETLEGILEALDTGPDTGPAPQAALSPEVHPGLGEFDFKALLDARFAGGGAPPGMHDDRRSHFRTLRDTVLMWQKGEIADPPESWAAFAARVEAARAHLMRPGAGVVFATSSGGAISQMIAATLGAPGRAQIELQLQTANCAVSRFIFSPRRHFLHGFNETPFLTGADDPLLTYS